MCLNGFSLNVTSNSNNDSLDEYANLSSLTKRDEKQEASLHEVKTNLRKQIVNAFKSEKTYKNLFNKELIQKHLEPFAESQEEKEMIQRFHKFTTYFTGFHKNRENMYSEEEKPTAIAYRIIHENLPIFMDNIKSFDKVAECSDIQEHFSDIESGYPNLFNNELHLKDIFCLQNFNNTLTQKQIELYNTLIGKRVDKNNEVEGINEYVNKYNQTQKDKSKRLPLLKPLYKMILCDREPLSWLTNELQSDEEMIDAINSAYNRISPILNEQHEESLKSLLSQIGEYDLSGIYITNNKSLTYISLQLFGRYDVFIKGIKEELRRVARPTKRERENIELYEGRIDKLFKSAKSFDIAYLNSLPQPERDDAIASPMRIETYFSELGAYNRDGKQTINLFTRIELAYNAASAILAGQHYNLNQSEEDIKRIKNLLDALKDLQRFIMPLLGGEDEANKDNKFDARIRAAWDTLSIITPLYNKVRNWLTRKPYSTEKIKLNFENALLLSGWDMNKEPDCLSILLRKNGMYFLAIMDKKHNHAFNCENPPSDGACYEKIDYKLLPGANKMLPKVFFSKSRIKEFAPGEEIINAYKEGTHKKGTHFNLTDCHRLIDFFKASIEKHEDWSKFRFKFSETNTYEDISGFYREVEEQGYMLGFRNVSESYINKLVDEGKLYLFQIWRKDFSSYSKGRPSLHTIYWKMLFDERNLTKVVYKLNGQAELFFRKKSLELENTTIHKAHQPIENKNILNKRKESTFDYDIIKDRRYTIDNFLFHVPITMNFNVHEYNNLNISTQQAIRDGEIEHIIGIDRGERNLLYVSVIDLKGNIIKQQSLNEIINKYGDNKQQSVNYKERLVLSEKARQEARQNWKKIERIKEIKNGYISQVVHIIAQMMVEYKAIVVLEDLNLGFKRERIKIEHQVYQKFERALIEKLNYFIDKGKEAYEPGGALRALQLTNKLKSFQEIGKQNGWLFYIPAHYTSKIDPSTGFVNLLDTHYENIKKARDFFSRFQTIRYNNEKDWFEFTFDYKEFTTKADGTRTQWTLCSYGTRIRTYRNQNNLWANEEIELTPAFKDVFNKADINVNDNLKDAICRLTDKAVLEELMHLMGLMLQMRNSIAGNDDIDYIISPVANDKGEFFRSSKENHTQPIDADANGAYNIARKGLWVIRQIQSSDKDKPNIAMSNKEWLKFAQEKPYLND